MPLFEIQICNPFTPQPTLSCLIIEANNEGEIRAALAKIHRTFPCQLALNVDVTPYPGDSKALPLHDFVDELYSRLKFRMTESSPPPESAYHFAELKLPNVS